jgi:hypothetical protein
MNAILEKLVRQAETWPQEDQEELVAYAREIEARRTGIYVLSDDEKSVVGEGLQQADRDDFVPDEQVIAADKRYQR